MSQAIGVDGPMSTSMEQAKNEKMPAITSGVRGPLRGVSSSGDKAPLITSSKVRIASRDERSEATRTAILLFVIGLSFIFLGSLFDPSHSTF